MQVPDDVAGGYASARAHMVDGQIRPNRVTDRRLLDVLRSMPREQFLPEALRPLAYIDDNLPLGGGRVLLEPLILARLLQLGRPRPGERVLVVGAGVGYGAAVLAGCGASVVGLEESPSLLAAARAACAVLAPGLTLVQGRLAAGHPDGGPYGLIVIEGAVRAIPPALASQLAQPDGRLVGVLAEEGRVPQAVIAEATPAGLVARFAFDASTPLLPSLLPAPAFTF